jgi:hypothetical protein
MDDLVDAAINKSSDGLRDLPFTNGEHVVPGQ